MITKAFVLIKTLSSKKGEITNELNQLEGVKSVDVVNYPCDLIATIEGESLAYINDLVIKRIKQTPNILRALTCICLD